MRREYLHPLGGFIFCGLIPFGLRSEGLCSFFGVVVVVLVVFVVVVAVIVIWGFPSPRRGENCSKVSLQSCFTTYHLPHSGSEILATRNFSYKNSPGVQAVSPRGRRGTRRHRGIANVSAQECRGDVMAMLRQCSGDTRPHHGDAWSCRQDYRHTVNVCHYSSQHPNTVLVKPQRSLEKAQSEWLEMSSLK